VTQNSGDHRSTQPDLEDLISLREAAELSGLSAGHLRLLVRQGKIWGIKLGRNWVTTAQAVQKYLAQERRPGPKSKSD
jgi:excisionase family DNA binding protein